MKCFQMKNIFYWSPGSGINLTWLVLYSVNKSGLWFTSFRVLSRREWANGQRSFVKNADMNFYHVIIVVSFRFTTGNFWKFKRKFALIMIAAVFLKGKVTFQMFFCFFCQLERLFNSRKPYQLWPEKIKEQKKICCTKSHYWQGLVEHLVMKVLVIQSLTPGL